MAAWVQQCRIERRPDREGLGTRRKVIEAAMAASASRTDPKYRFLVRSAFPAKPRAQTHAVGRQFHTTTCPITPCGKVSLAP